MSPRPIETAEAEVVLRHLMAAGRTQEAMALAEWLDDQPTRPRPTLGGSALWYAEHGLPVFPLQPLSKKPFHGTRGVKEATTDLDTVVSWWREHPNANIGLATGHGVDVIDFDGLEAHVSWGENAPDRESYGGIVLATVSTPRPGGLHVYVPTPEAQPGNRANLVPRVDYRGLGGYVVAPPSWTEVGTYDFLRPLDPTQVVAR